MHDVQFVRVVERRGNALNDRHHFVERQQVWILGKHRQILAFDELHRDVSQIVLFTGVVHLYNIRVIEPARRFCFAEKAILNFLQFVALIFVRKCHRFDGDLTANFWVLAQVHDAHRAFAELSLNLIATQHRFFTRAGDDHGSRA